MSVTTTAVGTEEHSGPSPIVDPWSDDGAGTTAAGPADVSATASTTEQGPIAAAIAASDWTREDLELLATIIGILSPVVMATLVIAGWL